MINIEHISKKYRDVQALNDINIQVDSGKIICLVGPNGSGKSTLIKIILGLTRPTSGVLKFDNANTTIGYLNELNALPNGYKGNDVLRKLEFLLGLDQSDSITELVDMFDIKAFISKKIKGYSKGMQKKIGFLVAFTGDPDLVILDEPFEGIDTIDRDKLTFFLKNYVSKGKTVILSTHILYELDSLCNSAHFLKKGTLVASLITQNDNPKSQSGYVFTNISSEFENSDIESCESISDIYRRVYQ